MTMRNEAASIEDEGGVGHADLQTFADPPAGEINSERGDRLRYIGSRYIIQKLSNRN